MHISQQQGDLQWIHKLQIALSQLDGPDGLLRVGGDSMDCVLEDKKKIKIDLYLTTFFEMQQQGGYVTLPFILSIYFFILPLLWSARQIADRVYVRFSLRCQNSYVNIYLLIFFMVMKDYKKEVAN